MAYRPAIDGLRAIAILLTCLFHFKIAGAQNGFLGIPIFFVVSGYLVGGIVLKSMEKGNFSLVTFWRRRLARILPALFIVSAIVLFVGYFILLPKDYIKIAYNIGAALLLNANHHLFEVSDYFGPNKYEIHFLHSWSLSVEEQFYLIFPLLAWGLLKFPDRKIILISSTTALTFVLFVWGRYNHPIAAHYFLVTRSWELLAGVLVFLLVNEKQPFVIKGIFLPWAGLIMAIAPAFFSQYASTLINIAMHCSVVVGTSIILCCMDSKRNTSVMRLLSVAPFRGLGLISYSLYLIHWPLLTLAMYYWVYPITTSGRYLLLIVSIFLAWVSWRYIEGPLRVLGNAKNIKNRQLFLVCAASVLVLLLIVQLIVQSKGYPNRVSDQVNTAAEAALDFSPLRSRCHSHETTNPVSPSQSCLLGKKNLHSTLAVWGDSHGVELAYALAEPNRFPVRQLTSSSCPPLLNLALPSQRLCAERNQKVIQYLAAHQEIQTVVLVQHFFGYYDISYSDWEMGINTTAAALRQLGRTVIVVGPIPYPDRNVPSDLARSEMFGWNNTELSLSRSEYYLKASPILAKLRHLSNVHDIRFVDLTPIMCNENICPFVVDGRPLYFDDNHLSLAGARLVATYILSSMTLLSRDDEAKSPEAMQQTRGKTAEK